MLTFFKKFLSGEERSVVMLIFYRSEPKFLGMKYLREGKQLQDRCPLCRRKPAMATSQDRFVCTKISLEKSKWQI